jgi:hypothetical protein
LFGNDVTASSDKDTWLIGAKLIEPYYFVLDMTPFDERKEDFIQVGIAPKSDKPLMVE